MNLDCALAIMLGSFKIGDKTVNKTRPLFLPFWNLEWWETLPLTAVLILTVLKCTVM